MLDQSPHQLARSRQRPELEGVERVLGDAENLPFGDDAFDRYVSAGSIEYWPDPLRGIAEAYRVTRADGVALVIGPVRPANPIARWLAETWMLFPAAGEYTRWMEQAGFTDVRVRELAPTWYRGSAPYALAVSRCQAGRGAVAGGRASCRVEEPVGRAAVRGALRRGLAGRRAVRADRGGARAAEARDVTTAAITARPNPVLVLWRFSRPHTIIGTALSIVGLYAIAASDRARRPGSADLLATLVAGLAVNIAIVGINQITDVEIDRINKPFLPIAAGELSLGRGEGDRRGLLRGAARDGR